MALKSWKYRVTLQAEKDEESLKSTAMLAEAYSIEGRLGKAEKLEVQAMQTRKISLGDNHPHAKQYGQSRFHLEII